MVVLAIIKSKLATVWGCNMAIICEKEKRSHGIVKILDGTLLQPIIKKSQQFDNQIFWGHKKTVIANKLIEILKL